MRSFYYSLVAAALLSACSGKGYAVEPARIADGMLVGPNGMTLYVFDKDSTGKSTCYDKCAVNWPPFYAEEGAKASGDYSLVMRDDGRKMWAFKGKPLYYWNKDKRPGDKTGDGVGDVWWIVKP